MAMAVDDRLTRAWLCRQIERTRSFAHPLGQPAIGPLPGQQGISRPGRRVYFGRDSVPDVLAGLGCSILTTSRGVMTGKEAVKAGVGGEVLCNVW